MVRIIFIALIGMHVLSAVHAQPALHPQGHEGEYPGRPRYPEGLLFLRGAASFTKYFGEFEGGRIGNTLQLDATYSLWPEFAVGLGAEFGGIAYERRQKERIYDSYAYQFNTSAAVNRITDLSAFHVQGVVNFFPRMFLNAYFKLGIGAVVYKPTDYEEKTATVRPDKDAFAAISVPVGLGIDYYVTRHLAINAELRNYFVMTDDLDAFPSQDIGDRLGVSGDQSEEGNDGWLSLSVGVTYVLFENNDLDGDLLLNEEEERLHTNPYAADTDEDGLSDYEEVRMNGTNPTLRDSDSDGLSDYLEVASYRTDPLSSDSDGDGLQDRDELMVFYSNPMEKDSDGDGLTDDAEISNGTNPKNIDSDGDGLTDFQELTAYHTDPLSRDTDADRLSDYDEVHNHHTAPTSADTDQDGISDGEEVVIWKSNPLSGDSDSDLLSDLEEIKRTSTSPTNADTDSDGIIDSRDDCPLLPEDIDGNHDDDGCPDDAQKCPEELYYPPTVADFLAFYEDALVPMEGPATSAALNPDPLRDTLRVGMLLTLFGVNFETDKDSIRIESYPILEENAKLFQRYPDLEVEIRGHTDSLANDDYNQRLSERRARAVKRYLVDQGIAPQRLATRGYGDRNPIATNKTELGRAKNRRVEFYILKTGKQGAAPRKR